MRLRGGHRTVVHGGVSECNTLYQTRISIDLSRLIQLPQPAINLTSQTNRAQGQHAATDRLIASRSKKLGIHHNVDLRRMGRQL